MVFLSLWFVIVFLRFSDCFLMVFVWFSYGFLWFSMVALWFSIVFLWFSFGFPMVFFWFSYGVPMVFYGLVWSIVFHVFSYSSAKPYHPRLLRGMWYVMLSWSVLATTERLSDFFTEGLWECCSSRQSLAAECQWCKCTPTWIHGGMHSSGVRIRALLADTRLI